MGEGRLRVLHVAPEASGGMVTHLVTLVQGLREAGVEVGVAAPSGVLARLSGRLPQGGAGIWWAPLPVGDGLRRARDLAAAAALRRAVAAWRPDLVHAHGHRAAWVAALAGAGRAGPRQVVTVHNFLPAAGLLPGAVLRLARWWLTRADGIIAVSETLAAHARALMGGRGAPWGGGRRAPRPEVAVVPNALSREWTASGAGGAAAGRGDGGRQVVAACVMRLHPSKGVDLLLEAAARLPRGAPVEVWVAGDGPCRPRLEARAREAGDRVRLLGWADPREVWSRADVAVLPWLREGASYSALEAMACGLPVVTLDCPGGREAVPEQAGFTVPPLPEALGAALLRLACDRELRARLGDAARLHAARRTGEQMAAETLAVYRRAAACRGGRAAR